MSLCTAQASCHVPEQTECFGAFDARLSLEED